MFFEMDNCGHIYSLVLTTVLALRLYSTTLVSVINMSVRNAEQKWILRLSRYSETK